MRRQWRAKAAFMAAALFGANCVMAETIRLEAENYKVGGEGVGYHDNDGGNNGGAYRSDDVDIENTGDVGGGYNVGWTGWGEWLKLTNDPTWTTNPTFAGGQYYLKTRFASDWGGGNYKVEVDGKSLSTGIWNTGGWQSWTTAETNKWLPITVSPGAHEVKLSLEGWSVNLNYIELATPDIASQRTVNAPALPSIAPGKWSVREVWNNGDVGDLGSTINSLQSAPSNPNAKVTNHRTPTINIHDSNGNGRFGNDATFQVVQQGLVSKGNVDNIALMAKGVIDAPEDGVYSFNVSSDDGFELSIDGKILKEANYGKGADDQIAGAFLTKGNHDVRLLYWEGGGGASVEVSAAKGNFTSHNKNFRPIGYKAAAPTLAMPGIQGDVTIKMTAAGAYTNHNAVDVKAAILAAGGAAIVGTANAINHSDPEDNGGQGSIGGDMAFINDAGGGQDEFAFLATGNLVIPQSGTYFIGFQSDDGAILRINGQTWDGITETADGNVAKIVGDTLMFDTPTGNSRTVGQITLAAGIYPFELSMYEWGGGANVEMFGGSMQGVYDLIMSGVTSMPDFDGIALVPEPGSLSLLGLGGLALLARRRKA